MPSHRFIKEPPQTLDRLLLGKCRLPTHTIRERIVAMQPRRLAGTDRQITPGWKMANPLKKGLGGVFIIAPCQVVVDHRQTGAARYPCFKDRLEFARAQKRAFMIGVVERLDAEGNSGAKEGPRP